MTFHNRSVSAALYSCLWFSSRMFAALIFPPPQMACWTDERPPAFSQNLLPIWFSMPSPWSAVILLIRNLKRKIRILSNNLTKFNLENTGREILLLELNHQPKPTQSLPTFDERWPLLSLSKVYHRAE